MGRAGVDQDLREDRDVSATLRIPICPCCGRGSARVDLDELLKESLAKFNAMTPEEQKTMREAQRESWVRGQTGWED